VKLLRIIVSSTRPLNIEEIIILLAIEAVHPSVSLLESEFTIFDVNSIQLILGPLIKVSESRVYLVDQSLKEYLIDLGNDETNLLATVFGVHVQPRPDTCSVMHALSVTV